MCQKNSFIHSLIKDLFYSFRCCTNNDYLPFPLYVGQLLRYRVYVNTSLQHSLANPARTTTDDIGF